MRLLISALLLLAPIRTYAACSETATCPDNCDSGTHALAPCGCQVCISATCQVKQCLNICGASDQCGCNEAACSSYTCTLRTCSNACVAGDQCGCNTCGSKQCSALNC